MMEKLLQGGKIKIIGINKAYPLPKKAYDLIFSSDYIIGKEEFLSLFDIDKSKKILLSKNLFEVISFIKEHYKSKNIVILASGDPNFFGIAETLRKYIGNEIEVIPSVSYMQIAFSKANLSWEDASFVSLHGRSIVEILPYIVKGVKKIGIYTDRINSPDKIAKFLISKGVSGKDYYSFVCEDIGGEEKVFSGYLEDLVDKEFSYPNILILKKEREDFEFSFGIDDELFFKEKNMITKKEIRVIVLSYLNLNKAKIFWDIGAGSGSISIEASKIMRNGMVYAIEKDENKIDCILKNIKKFSAVNVEIIKGEAPEILSFLPQPDRIFIGGSGGKFKEILEVSFDKLEEDGILISNIVTVDNLSYVISFAKSKNIKYKILSLNISKAEDIKNIRIFKALNPVFLFYFKK